MRGSGRDGTRFPKITGLPLWTRTPSRPQRSPKCLAFLLASVTRQGGPQLPHLPLCHHVPATKSLHRHGQKGNPLPHGGLPSSLHLFPIGIVVKVPIGIVVKVAHRDSLAVVHSELKTLPSISPTGWSPSGPDEKGRIAPHEPKRQPLIEVSGEWLVQSSCL